MNAATANASTQGGDKTPSPVVTALKKALANDDPVSAYDLAEQALGEPSTPEHDHHEIRLQRALALCRCGAFVSAVDDLTRLLTDHQDARTLTMYGRVLTDVAIATGRQDDWRRAKEQFLAAEAAGSQTWSGINLAFTQLLAGDHVEAKASAQRVFKNIPPLSASKEWDLATHAEAHLLLGEIDRAHEAYEALRQHATTTIEHFISLHRRFPLIAKALGLTGDELQRIAPPPTVAVCDGSGHPEAAVDAALEHVAGMGRWLTGFTTLGSEVECTFAERVLDAGGMLRIIAPAPRERLRFETFSTAAGHAVTLAARKNRVQYVALGTDPHPSAATDRAFAQSCALGLARLSAQRYGCQAIERTTGSKSFLVDLAEDRDVIGTMLFADVKGFSKLDDTGINRFMTKVMGSTRPMVTKGPDRPFAYQSWGDAIYGNFANCAAGARFALALRDHLAALDLPALGLPAELGMRIALHAGPVTLLQDPLGDRRYFTGTHVCRTARMEPVTPPGQVYVSEPFAALLAAEGDPGVRAIFVGKRRLAKDFGDYAVYRLEHGDRHRSA